MRKDIIVIGTSAGGIEALKIVFAALPKDLEASIFVVLHTSPDSPGLLAEILARAGPLRASTVRSSEPIESGKVYVASPDHHLVLEPGVVTVTKGPRENRCRPAVDPLFRSAAQTYGPRVIGVILTGALDDGAAGLWAVKHLGGTAIVQDPSEAFAPSMPRNAMKYVTVDHCLPLARIPALLTRLVVEPGDQKGGLPVPSGIQIEVDIAKAKTALHAGVLTLGDPSNFACPECHGVLLQLSEGNRTRFRCHTGHAYSPESLMAEIHESVEDALWNAIRSIEESVLMLQHLAQHAAGNDVLAEQLRTAAIAAEGRADLARQAVFQHSGAQSPDSRER